MLTNPCDRRQQEAAEKEELRVKDAAFFAAVKYTLLTVGLLLASCILYYIGYKYSPGVFLLTTKEAPVSFLPCVGLWGSTLCVKKARDNTRPDGAVFRWTFTRWYIAQTILAVLVSLLWALDFLLSFFE